MSPPYLRIVAEIRRRIESGQLRQGDRVPSTRHITKEWGVAMATATKVLATLRQQGLVRVVPGVGTVVDAPAPAPRTVRRSEPDRQRIVRAAMDIADTEGIAALSMRRLAAHLGIATMSLYRHVRDKDELVLLMIDTAYGEDELPDPPPSGWRARLELLARLEWAAYRRHPWLAQVVSFTRPLMAPNAMAHTEWAMRAVADLGLGPNAMLHVSVTVAAFVRGVAMNLEPEAAARQDTGLTDDQWMQTQDAALREAFSSGRFPTLAHVFVQPDLDLDLDLDTLFEFGLHRMLDGLAVLTSTPPCWPA